jgi:hypothetical protein
MTRRAVSRLLLAGLRASDCDRMVEAFSLALPGVGRPDGNDRLVAVADDVADVLAWAGLL